MLVFDTGNLPGVTRRQIAEIRRLTDKPVRYVVNSHWHPDHNLGNAMYRAAFPGVRIIGTAATRDGIRDRAAGYLKDMAGFAATDSLMKVRLATGKLRDGSAMNDTLRANWSVVTRDYDEFLPEVQTAQPLACDQVFADSLTLRLGRRIVKVVTCGLGNTAGDAFVYVPDSHVLLTGDLLTLPCPFPGTSYFSGWIAALERLRAYGARAIVPGHGAVLHDADYLDLTRELLVWTRDQAMAAVREGRSLEDARKSVDFSAWQKRFAGGDLVRWNAFENFYPGPALERAYAEAKYLSEGPLPGR